MKLSARGRYAVMALVDIALYGRSDSAIRDDVHSLPVSLRDIALRQSLSQVFLEQIFLDLRRGGLVRGVRGPGGGYYLARSPRDITIYEIIGAVGEFFHMARYEEGLPLHCLFKTERCGSHNLWRHLEDRIGKFLASVRLSDIVDDFLQGKDGDVDTVPLQGHSSGEKRAGGESV